MRVDIWIRKENLDKWNSISEKSLWVNKCLEEKVVGAEQSVARETKKLQLVNLGTGEVTTLEDEPEERPEEDEDDKYANWFVYLPTGRIYDSVGQEEVEEFTKEDVAELKRRGQVKA
jgi:hypothetical protein